MRTRVLEAAIALVLAVPAAADVPAPLSFTSRTDPTQVALGQPFAYVIEVVHEKGVSYSAPQHLELGTLAVRGVGVRAEPDPAGERTVIRIETAVYDRLGPVTLPDVTLDVRGAGGTSTLTVPGPSVTVATTAQDQELAPPHPPEPRTIPSYRVVWIALGCLAAGALAWLIVRKLRALRREHEDVLSAPPGTPEDRARAALDALHAEALPLTGRTREHHFRLSEIVRRYLEETASIQALDMTTGELLHALALRPPPGLDIHRFGAWLERGDLVRFARLEVEARQAAAELDEARALVEAMAAARRPPPQESAA